MIDEVTGIVVSEQNYGEKSKIINILTKEKGIIGIMVKGGRSLKSPLRSVTGKLTYGVFNIFYKKDKLSKLIDVNILDNFNNIKKNIDLISYASYLVDLAYQVTRHSNDSLVFDNLINGLIKINEGYNPDVITNILELKYLDNLGVLPVLDSCVECGSVNNIVTLSSDRGGYLCSNCRINEPIISIKTIKLVRLYYYVDISKINNIDVNINIVREINDFLDNYYERYTGLYLKSKSFLKNLKNLG